MGRDSTESAVCALLCAALCACGSRAASDAGPVAAPPIDGTGAGSSFMLSLTPGALTLSPGASGTLEVSITRQQNFTGVIELTVEPAELGEFTLNPLTNGASLSQLRVVAPPSAPEGLTRGTVTARSGSFFVTATFELTISRTEAFGLVDDDGADDSPADRFFPALLRRAGVQFARTGADALDRFHTVVWYTGARRGAFSQADQSALRSFLDGGRRRLIVFSTAWPSLDDLGEGTDAQHSPPRLNARGRSVMTGLTLSVGARGTRLAPVRPTPGTDTLFSTLGTAPVAIAVARKQVGAARSSTAVFFGFAFEDVIDIGTDARAVAFERVLTW